jgi:hypothetical protein
MNALTRMIRASVGGPVELGLHGDRAVAIDQDCGIGRDQSGPTCRGAGWTPLPADPEAVGAYLASIAATPPTSVMVRCRI